MLFKLIIAIALVAGVVWGGIYWLANGIEPQQRDMSFRVPPEKFIKK
jgi:hypothetical protein